MKNLYQPASWMFYILAILIFFFLGASIAGILGIADQHGLAGGPVIIMIGAMTGLVAWFLALYIAYKFPKSTIININKVLLVVFIGIAIYFFYKTNLFIS